jgi:hypothetical protein
MALGWPGAEPIEAVIENWRDFRDGWGRWDHMTATSAMKIV